MDRGSRQQVEPPPADGEGQEFSMTQVSDASGAEKGGRHVEPPPADGEGEEFSMTQVAAHTCHAPSEASPPAQDGRYHFTPVDEEASEAAAEVNASWTSLEEPEAVGRPPVGAAAAASAAAPHSHPPKYVGDAAQGEGFREPGQDIESALPGRYETEEYGVKEEEA